MLIAVVIILLVIGTLVFHFVSALIGWYFTPLASNWALIDVTVDITFWVTGIVFVAVNLFLAYCVLKFRHREGNKAEYDPENTKLEGWLTVGTALGVAAMLAPGLVVWAMFVTVPEDAAELEAVGQQWHWSYRFPGDDGEFGDADIRHISEQNPFGMDPEDPNGRDDILVASPVVHLPVNQPTKLLLRSKDVLHDFAVPQFRIKMDLVPGMVSYAWFTPTQVGEYEVLCEELCGVAHFAMRGRVVVQEQDDFQAWLAAQPTFAEASGQPTGNAAAGQATYALCAACHGPQGQGMQPLNAPKLAGQQAWYLKRQLTYFKEGVRGTHEEDIFGRTMAPIMAAVPDETAIDNVVAYIQTLPDEPAPATVIGDTARGEELYVTCGACHGVQGEGIWALNAPVLAGATDWYLATQLRNFRSGVRGLHEQDLYGHQMMLMVTGLKDDAAIDDVVAYINTLH